MHKSIYDYAIEIDLRTYPLEVIYRVCYLYTDRWYIWLDYRSDHTLAVSFTPKSKDSISLIDLKGEFGNSLADYSVRWSVSNETKEVREQLIKTALSEANRKSL